MFSDFTYRGESELLTDYDPSEGLHPEDFTDSDKLTGDEVDDSKGPESGTGGTQVPTDGAAEGGKEGPSTNGNECELQSADKLAAKLAAFGEARRQAPDYRVAGTGGGPPPRSYLTPPRNKQVDPNAMYRQLQFDPAGPGHFGAALRAPGDLISAWLSANYAEDETAKRFVNPTTAAANAFQHALWSTEMTRGLGIGSAKLFGDAHDVSEDNSTEERLKDLFNNAQGRLLASDPSNSQIGSSDLAYQALIRNQLQTGPVNIKPTP